MPTEVSKSKFVVSIGLFMIGTLLSFVFSLLAVWADVEAVFYGFSKQASEAFSGLHCPIFITPQEKETVTIELKNSSDQNISPSVRIELSSPGVFITSNESLRLAPGESGTIEKTVGPENIDLRRFIFVKALVYANYPMPTQQNTCGILVIPLPGNGKAISFMMMFLSTLFSFGSILFLYQKKLATNKFRLILFLAVVIFLAMLFSFLGWWLYSVIFLVIAILTLIGILNSLLK